MAQAVGDVIVALRADISPFQQGMRSATRSMRDVEERGRTMGAALGQAGRGVSNLNSALSTSRGQLSAVQQRINAVVGVTEQLETSARGSAQAFQEFDRARAQVDSLRASVDPLFAASKKYESAVEQLNNALRLGVMTQGEYDAALERVGQSYLTAGAQANVYGKAMRASTQHTTNLMFQFQDIGMMLAAGQSPLMLAMQQGTQVSGVFQQMRNSGQSAFRGIIGGLGAMISPMSLVTIGAIAGGAALVQWAASALSAEQETFDFADAMDALTEASSGLTTAQDILEMSVDDLIAKYGQYSSVVLGAARNLAELQAAQSRALLTEQIDMMTIAMREYMMTTNSLVQSGVSQHTALQNIARDLSVMEDQGRALESAFRAVRDAMSFDEQLAAMGEVNRLLEEAGVDYAAIPPELREALIEANNLTAAMAALAVQADNAAAAAASISVGVPLFNQDLGGEGLLPPGSPEGIPRRSGGGGGGSERDWESEFEAFQGQLMTETERLQQEYDTRLEQLREFRAQRVATEEEFNEAERRLTEQHQNQMRDLEFQAQSARLAIISGTLGDIAGLIESTGNRNLSAVRALRTAEAVIDGYTAAVSAWRDGMTKGGPVLAAVQTAGSLARTGSLIAQIQSSGKGGAGGGSAGVAAAAAAPRPTQNVVIDMINASPSQVSGIQNLVDMMTEATRQGYDLNALVRSA